MKPATARDLNSGTSFVSSGRVPLCVTLLSNTRHHFPFLTGIHFYLPFFLLTQINIIFEFERKKASILEYPTITHPLTNRLLIDILILTFFAFLRENERKPSYLVYRPFTNTRTLSSVSHKHRTLLITFWSHTTREKKYHLHNNLLYYLFFLQFTYRFYRRTVPSSYCFLALRIIQSILTRYQIFLAFVTEFTY